MRSVQGRRRLSGAGRGAPVSLTEDPINRYKVGSETLGLKVNSDGSIRIPIQHEEPKGPE
jgi:hypothetical protein